MSDQLTKLTHTHSAAVLSEQNKMAELVKVAAFHLMVLFVIELGYAQETFTVFPPNVIIFNSNFPFKEIKYLKLSLLCLLIPCWPKPQFG